MGEFKKKKWVFKWTKPRKRPIRKVDLKPVPEPIDFSDEDLGLPPPIEIHKSPAPAKVQKINWEKVEKAFKQKSIRGKLAEEFKRLKFDSLLLPKKIVLPPRD